jgi:glycosyltransferase involved in cell wall biosynthesis
LVREDTRVPDVSVVISAKNRPDRLRRALESLRTQSQPILEFIVVDDGSSPPLSDLGNDVQILRNERSEGMCAARNTGLRAATGTYVVVIDDDAELSAADGIARGVQIFARVPDAAVIGFRQLRPDGAVHYMQPAHSEVTAETNRFYGYGFMVHRDTFLDAGAFADFYGYYGEETEVALRLLKRRKRILYAPDIRVIHHEDPRGRDARRIARLVLRNSLFTVLSVYPAMTVAIGMLKALANAVRSSFATIGLDLPGKALVAVEVVKRMPELWDRRDPVRISDLLHFRRLGRSPRPVFVTPTSCRE